NKPGHLILDVNSLTSLGFDEIRTMRELVFEDDSRFGLIFNQEKQPDFWRILVLWSMENNLKIYQDLNSAKAELDLY
ncbi:MAG: hypothetical protein LBS44_01795, partial [Deltaproteobacteria bacterium]|nr:hypothetical protein [Deltaproteobacteria bacterium]